MTGGSGRAEARAVRVAFSSIDQWAPGAAAFREHAVEFVWHKGMALQQRQRSVASMHEAISRTTPNAATLEVSTRAVDYDLGKALSAFNLMLRGYPVENVFQSAKVTTDGGPYSDILNLSPVEAKRDCRIQTRDSKADCQTNGVRYQGKSFFDADSGVCPACQSRPHRQLAAFKSRNFIWGLEPRSHFYDALYITAVLEPANKALARRVADHDTFTDIAFNQKVPYAEVGPFNCQARSCAIVTTLSRSGLTHDEVAHLVGDPETMTSLYPSRTDAGGKQETLWPE